VTDKPGNHSAAKGRAVKVPTDSVRFKVLVLLNECSADAAEVAAELGLSAEEAARELEQMLAVDLIEVVGEAASESGAELRYRALVRALLDDEEWIALSVDERQRLMAWVIEMINADVVEAMESGTAVARADSHASRTVSVVDEQGWRELTGIQAEALKASFAVQAASAERLAESSEEGITVLSAMLCWELPARQQRPS
jgi:hypothetical protein